ncbi:hypothetical protein L596_021277 [Steinernema carpocapsae]|uniref:Uncharacterized protein n=1 Tax=Steinernema carpocapsae TaxID=34508 RepID=A0A4U5MI75_STECR|nr:hypothetical protein L596_021277 [Steinernema carpocapsae]
MTKNRWWTRNKVNDKQQVEFGCFDSKGVIRDMVVGHLYPNVEGRLPYREMYLDDQGETQETMVSDFMEHYTGASLSMSYCNPRETSCFTYSDGMDKNSNYHAKLKVLWNQIKGVIIYTTSVQFGAGKELDKFMRMMLKDIPRFYAKHQSFMCLTVTSDTAKAFYKHARALYESDGRVHKMAEVVMPVVLPKEVDKEGNPARTTSKDNVPTSGLALCAAKFFDRHRMMKNELYQRISEHYGELLVCSGYDSGERTGTHCLRKQGCVLEGGLKKKNDHRKRCGSPKQTPDAMKSFVNDFFQRKRTISEKLICVGDANRAIGHVYRKAAGAFCFENDKLWSFFLSDFEVVFTPYEDCMVYPEFKDGDVEDNTHAGMFETSRDVDGLRSCAE